MDSKKPKRLKGLKEVLEEMNLETFQKLDNFHIIKFDDHPEQLGAEFHAVIEDCFEISISNNSDFVLGVDGKKFKNFKNHLSFTSPGSIIDIDKHEVVGEDIGYMIYFTADFLRFTPSFYSMIKRFPYYNIHHVPVYKLKEANYAFYSLFMEKIYDAFQELDKDAIEVIRAYLIIMLFETKHLVSLNVLHEAKKSRAEEITYKFEQLLKGTEHKKQKLSYYASKLNISGVYLSECVKKATGSSAKQLLTNYIIYEAKYLLSESLDKLDVIAHQLGFKETTNFINFFKKNTKSTPNQFRSLNSN
jgi:AraC-like DNA-binding protein